MPRPDNRPLRRLPTLAARQDTLEKCVFCPKLCRSACPVSNVEPRETLTPWGKMSAAYFAARGDVPIEPSIARPAWACTGCFACRDSCDHQNDVAGTLLETRAALVSARAPAEGAARTIARFEAHRAATQRGTGALAAHPAVRSDARDGLLIGCGYVRAAPGEARDAIDAATALIRGPVALVGECCGLPLLLAGDAAGFKRRAESFAQHVKGVERLLVADAGCALALRVRYPEHGVTVDPTVELIVERAGAELGGLSPVRSSGGAAETESIRWHDPCQLGRGLGVYEAPRAVLTRALGHAPAEFRTRREKGTCSGGGGLLPVTMPDAARAIAAARLDEHARAGGGRVVTACASSLVAMRKAGGAVDDLVTWIARAARPWRPVG